MGTYLLRLSWPPRGVWQNTHAHWRVRQRATKSYRQEAYLEALARGVRGSEGASARLAFEFHPPNRARRDVSNVIGACKPAIDGISDALCIDDSAFRVAWPEVFSKPTEGGAILVTVEAESK